MKVTVWRMVNACSGCSSSPEIRHLDFDCEPRVGDRIQVQDPETGDWLHLTISERWHVAHDGLPIMDLQVIAKTDAEIRQDKIKEWLHL